MSRPFANRPDIYAAIAHPIRRRIIELLAQAERPVNELAGHFDISLPSLSGHLRVLRQSRVVHQRRVGRGRIYRVNPDALAELQRWLSQLH